MRKWWKRADRKKPVSDFFNDSDYEESVFFHSRPPTEPGAHAEPGGEETPAEEAPSDTRGWSVDPQHKAALDKQGWSVDPRARAQPDNPRPLLGPRAADTNEEPDAELKKRLDSVSDSEERVAKMRERRRAREEREYEESRKRHGARFFEADAELSKARRAGKNALGQIRDVEFTAEEVELLQRELEAAQRMLGLVGAALTGDSGTDWDAELFALEQRRQWGSTDGPGEEEEDA